MPMRFSEMLAARQYASLLLKDIEYYLDSTRTELAEIDPKDPEKIKELDQEFNDLNSSKINVQETINKIDSKYIESMIVFEFSFDPDYILA
jgi:hypothetical protein